MALFDGIGDLTGHIYADKFISNMKGATYGKAYSLVTQAFEGARKGKGGVTENDRKQLVKIVNAFGKQYGVDTTSLATAAKSGYVDLWAENLYKYSPKSLTGSETGDIKNGKVTEGKDGYVGYPVGAPVLTPNVIESDKTNTNKPNTNTNTNKPNTGTGSTGSGTKPSTTPATGGATPTKPPSNNTNTTTTKTETPVEKPVYEGADAVAKRHGIDYNLENTLADYNQRTNDYYDAATAEYEADRTRYVQASNNYANRIMDEYLDSYANATATAAGRGATAAAALMTDLNTQSINAANDLGMLQTINNLNEARKAELVKNKYLAEQYYNDLGTYLSQVSTAQYGADVNKYVKAMDAYAQQYAADRALAENEARAASTKYAGLANANLYKSQTASSTSSWQRLYNYYLARYNGNEQMAASAVNKNLGVEGGAS